MEVLQLFRESINLDDYPDYAAASRITEVPGYLLMEQMAVQGVRVGVPAGCLASFVYFYGIYRPRLSFSDRRFTRFRPYLLSSAAYMTPIGAVCGVVYGIFDFRRSYSVDQLRRQREVEEHGARQTVALRERRRASLVERLRARQPWWETVLIRFGYLEDPVDVALVRAGLGREFRWEEMLVPNSLSWVAARSSVHDPRYYSDYKPCVSDGGGASHSLAESRYVTKCLGSGQFSKIEIDHLVSCAMQCKDKTTERYTRTASRWSTMGMVTAIFFGKSGGLAYRFSYGFGFGIVIGAIISAMELDNMMPD